MKRLRYVFRKRGREMFCKKCGERLEPQDKFCPKCGTLVTYGDASANVSDEKSEEYYSDGNIADIEQTERITRDENYGIDRVPLKQISFLKYLLLSLITFGIYGIYTIYKFTKNVNILCEGEKRVQIIL